MPSSDSTSSDFEEGFNLRRNGEPCNDVDFCSLFSSFNFHESGTDTGAYRNQQTDDACDVLVVHLQQSLKTNSIHLDCEEVNLISLMQRCENDTSKVAAVLTLFITQGSSCCREIQQALGANHRTQLLVQAVEIPNPLIFCTNSPELQ
jgi:hypothetical protein